MAEVEGMAEGSGQALDLMLVANFRQEIQTALDANASRVDVPDSCTDVLLVHPEGGHGVGWAHNEDYGALFFDRIYLVRQTWEQVGDASSPASRSRSKSKKAEDVKYVSFAYPGVLPGWAPGWNGHGVAMSWNVLYPKNMRQGGGVAVAFVCRDVLGSARNIEEALKLAAPPDLALGQNLNVGELGSKRIVTVETAPGGVSSVLELKRGGASVFHANEYLRLAVPQCEGNLASSRHRRKTFEATTPRPASMDGALEALGDTSDAAFPTFRRNDTTAEDTLFTTAFDLEAGTVTVYRDNPRRGASAIAWTEALLMDEIIISV